MPTALYIYDNGDGFLYSENREVGKKDRIIILPNGMPAIVTPDNWAETSKFAEGQMEVELARSITRDEKMSLANAMRDTAMGFQPSDPIAEANAAGASVTYSREFEKMSEWIAPVVDKGAEAIGKIAGKAGAAAGNVGGSVLTGFISSIGGAGMILILGVVIYFYATSHVKLRTHTVL